MMKQKSKKGRKLNIVLTLLAVLSAILCIILPGRMMDIKKQEVANVYMDVPEEFYPTSSYYEVTKISSEKLSEYQKRQLISGQWESEISEVDREYYEDSGYHMEEKAKALLNDLVDKNLYPMSIKSDYLEWYNWKCTYMQALDTNFRSYAGFFWRVEFTHYEREDKLTVYMTPEGSVLEMIYQIENEGNEGTDGKAQVLGFSDKFGDAEYKNLADLLLGEEMVVQDISNPTDEEKEAVMQYIEQDQLMVVKGDAEDNESDEKDLNHTTKYTLGLKKIMVTELGNDNDTTEYYFYIYYDEDKLVEGFVPVN